MYTNTYVYMRKYVRRIHKIHVHRHIYIRTYIHTYVLNYLHTYIHTYIHTFRVVKFDTATNFPAVNLNSLLAVAVTNIRHR